MPVEEKGPFLPGTAFSFNYMAWLKGNAGKAGVQREIDEGATYEMFSGLFEFVRERSFPD